MAPTLYKSPLGCGNRTRNLSLTSQDECFKGQGGATEWEQGGAGHQNYFHMSLVLESQK